MKHHLLILLTSLLAATAALAHHSPFLYFDPKTTVEVEGTISKVHWRNPHVEFILDVVADDGSVTHWVLETHSVSILRRMQLDRDAVSVGAQVKVAGMGSNRGHDEIFITNMLLPGGVEIGFDPGAKPRWAQSTEGDGSIWLVTEESVGGGDISLGIFHVWSTSLINGDGSFLFENYNFPLTESAAAAREEYDMFEHPIIGSCESKGMPTIMEQPYPMQFLQGDNQITMHMEEGDTVRVFDMTPGAILDDQVPSKLGYSIGSWQNGVLVVTTKHSNWPYVDMTGVPNTSDAIYVEKFMPSEDGKALNYTLTITDPSVFTEAPSFGKQWLWISDAEVSPYDCEARETEE